MRLADVGHVRARAAIAAVDGVVAPVPVRGERVHVVVAGAYGVTARAPVDVVGPAAGVHPVRASNSCEGVVPVVPGNQVDGQVCRDQGELELVSVVDPEPRFGVVVRVGYGVVPGSSTP